MDVVQINKQNTKYFSEDFIKGFNTGTSRQYQHDTEGKTSKWIPVSERKPEVEQLVWLYTKDNPEPYNVFIGYLSEDYWWVECGVNYSEYSPHCIIAWQPLNKPKSYDYGSKMEE